MKKLALFLFLAPFAAHAQLGNVTLKHFAGAPTGPCQRNQFAMNDSTGAQYNCLNGSWNLVSSGGGTTTNAATFDNGGAGAASGATFNGSAPVDISYNTIGAANLALGNLFSVAVNTALLPSADNTISLDSPNFRYIDVIAAGVFGWSSAGVKDTSLSRDSASTVDVGNGTAGDASGTIRAANHVGTAANGGWSAPNTSTGANCTHTSGNNCIYSDANGFHENAGGTDYGYLIGGGTSAVTSGNLPKYNGTTGARIQDSGIAVPTAAGAATLTQTICSGTIALGTSLIASGAKSTVATATCTGLATTDNIMMDFNADPSTVTGYAPSANGTLTIIKFPTANTINVYQYNDTASSITPGAMTVNYRVVR
jgi:hypothetical protein